MEVFALKNRPCGRLLQLLTFLRLGYLSFNLLLAAKASTYSADPKLPPPAMDAKLVFNCINSFVMELNLSAQLGFFGLRT